MDKQEEQISNDVSRFLAEYGIGPTHVLIPRNLWYKPIGTAIRDQLCLKTINAANIAHPIVALLLQDSPSGAPKPKRQGQSPTTASDKAIAPLIGDQVATSRFGEPGYNIEIEREVTNLDGKVSRMRNNFDSPFQYTLTPTWAVIKCFNDHRELQDELCIPREKIIAVQISRSPFTG